MADETNGENNSGFLLAKAVIAAALFVFQGICSGQEAARGLFQLQKDSLLNYCAARETDSDGHKVYNYNISPGRIATKTMVLIR